MSTESRGTDTVSKTRSLRSVKSDGKALSSLGAGSTVCAKAMPVYKENLLLCNNENVSEDIDGICNISGVQDLSHNVNVQDARSAQCPSQAVTDCSSTDKLSCPVCGECLQNKEQLSRHLFQEHDTVSNRTCPVCSVRLGSREYLMRHLHAHIDGSVSETPYICLVCGLTFANKVGKALFFLDEYLK